MYGEYIFSIDPSDKKQKIIMKLHSDVVDVNHIVRLKIEYDVIMQLFSKRKTNFEGVYSGTTSEGLLIWIFDVNESSPHGSDVTMTLSVGATKDTILHQFILGHHQARCNNRPMPLPSPITYNHLTRQLTHRESPHRSLSLSSSSPKPYFWDLSRIRAENFDNHMRDYNQFHDRLAEIVKTKIFPRDFLKNCFKKNQSRKEEDTIFDPYELKPFISQRRNSTYYSAVQPSLQMLASAVIVALTLYHMPNQHHLAEDLMHEMEAQMRHARDAGSFFSGFFTVFFLGSLLKLPIILPLSICCLGIMLNIGISDLRLSCEYTGISEITALSHQYSKTSDTLGEFLRNNREFLPRFVEQERKVSDLLRSVINREPREEKSPCTSFSFRKI